MGMKNCNSSVTHSCNSYPKLTKTLQEFLIECKKFNEEKKRSFCFIDFPNIRESNFRQRIRRIKPFIEVIAPGHPTFYKVREVKLPLDSHKITLGPMGVKPELMEILRMLKDQPPMIHDIKIQVEVQIHEKLVEKGCSVNPKNHCVVISDIPVSDNNLIVRALVYPKLVQIDVGCSFKPLVYDYGSLLSLHEYLKEVSIYLTCLSGIQLKLVKDWIITHYHFNIDGSHEINGRDFHLTFNEVSSGQA